MKMLPMPKPKRFVLNISFSSTDSVLTGEKGKVGGRDIYWEKEEGDRDTRSQM
jgi:hypothetical protein